MVPINFVAIAVAILAAYQGSTIIDHSIPGLQTIPLSVSNIIGVSSNNNPIGISGNSQQNSNVQVIIITDTAQSTQVTLSQSDYQQLISQIPSSSISNAVYTIAPATSTFAQALQFYSQNTPDHATISLCGKSVQEYEYDKTDMSTGGDIMQVMSPLPDETATIHFTNGTIAKIITNQDIQGCVTGLVPSQNQLYVSLNGDWNGTFTFDTIHNLYIMINCVASWQETVDYDQYGNVLAKYNPPINHLANCQT